MATGSSPSKAKSSKSAVPMSHPKYTEMILKAVMDLKERGGSSRAGILKYILANFTVKQDPAAVNGHLKHAIRTMTEAGVLKHAKQSTTGVTGRFKLGDKKPKPATEKKPKDAAKSVPKSKPKSPMKSDKDTDTESPKKTMNKAASPKKLVKASKISPKKVAKVSPKKTMKVSPKKFAKVSPKKTDKISPKKAMKASPQKVTKKSPVKKAAAKKAVKN